MMDMNRVKGFAEENFDDLNCLHTKNVVRLALEIAGKEGANKQVVEAAAWLHDIGKIDKEAKGGNHHLYSIKIAEMVLTKAGAGRESIQKVCQCIKEHMGPPGEILNKLLEEAGIMPGKLPRPSTIESKCLYDADMIDFLGPFGIAKVIFLDSKKGKSFADIIKERKQLTEAAYEDLQTKTGRDIGDEYYRIAKEFYKKLNMEE